MPVTAIHREGASPRRSYQRAPERLRQFMGRKAVSRAATGRRRNAHWRRASVFHQQQIRKAIQMLAEKAF